MKLRLTILSIIAFTYGFSQNNNSNCLTSSCWFYSRNTTAGYLPPDGSFTFNNDGTFILNNYLTGNTHRGIWTMNNSTDVLLHYTSTTARALNSDHTIKLIDCSNILNGGTQYKRMDQVNFINSQNILTPEGYPWEIYCNGQLMN